MNIWSKPITSPESDDKTGSYIRWILFLGFSVAGLAAWTWVVKSVHDYVYHMSAWSDGASARGPENWTPYILLWTVPVLIAIIAFLLVRASMQKKEPIQPSAQPPPDRGELREKGS